MRVHPQCLASGKRPALSRWASILNPHSPLSPSSSHARFGLVTGFLERNENPRDGALREVTEEVGIADVEMVESLGAIGGPQELKRNQVMLGYHVRAYGPIKIDERELQAFKRVPVTAIKSFPFATGLLLEEFVRRHKARQGKGKGKGGEGKGENGAPGKLASKL